MADGARRRSPTAALRPPALLLGALVASLVLLSCSQTSEPQPLAHDRADDTVPGPLPTAPTTGPDSGEGLTPSANALLAELEQVQQGSDLCAVLSGEAFAGLFESDFDTTALVTNLAGVTRLITAVDATFTHLVEISPPELDTALRTVKDVWTRLASLGPVPDAEARAQAILAEPQVVQANTAILGWATANCGIGELPGT